MKRWLTLLTIMGTWAALGVPGASAQQLGTYNQPQMTPGPSFSPYLNMIRNNPAVGLNGIALPQLATYGSLQQLQQDVRYGQNGQLPLGMMNQGIANSFSITGHPVTFGYTAQFFPQSGGQLAGMGMGMGGPGGYGGTGYGNGFGNGIGVGGFGMGMGGMGGGGTGPTINSPLPQGTMPRQ